MKNRNGFQKPYILLLALFTLLVGGCMPLTNDDTNPSQTWDVSQGHELERVGWPPDQTSDTYHLSNVVVELKLSESLMLENWDASNVYITQNLQAPTQIQTIMIRTQPLTLEEAYNEALRLATLMDLPQERIEEWYQARLANGEEGFEQTNFIATRNDLEPALTLESAASFNEAKPWILSFVVFWKE